jgi:hypothetical protein
MTRRGIVACREILGGASRGDRILTVGDAEIAASICVRVNSVVGSLFDRPQKRRRGILRVSRSPRNNGYKSVPFGCGSPQRLHASRILSCERQNDTGISAPAGACERSSYQETMTL